MLKYIVNMKKMMLKNILIVLFLPIFLLSFGIVFFANNSHIALADTSTVLPSITNAEERFSVNPTVYSKNGLDLSHSTQDVTNEINETYTYHIFKWSEISHISFTFTVNLQGSTDTYVSYSFVVRNVKTQNLETDIGKMDERVLSQSPISNNTVTIPNLHYYFDTNMNVSETAVRKVGNDFGLYKFEFIYTTSEGSSSFPHSMGALYIAIVPDDMNDIIDDINPNDFAVEYTVSSSNMLMSVFNFTISLQNEFLYVNPSLIEWTVIGTDKDGADYVLSQKMKDSDPAYANYRVIWGSQLPTEPEGVSFLFDSHNIEGKWVATCTIYDTDHNALFSARSAQVSTIKAPPKSYLWLVLLIAGLFIVGGIVALVIYKKKTNSKS